MIYLDPKLESDDYAVLELHERQKEELRGFTQQAPRRWTGSLRRLSFARAMRGSNSIEGYHATLDNAVDVVDNEPPLDPRSETTLALFGYRDALTYIMQTARDPYFELSRQFLKSLHFMMISYDMSKNPGRYRQGFIQVINEKTGESVYVAPDVTLLDDLVGELIEYLKSDGGSRPPVLRAAMAHLNLTMIHPFSDGNGRMARALQTFVLAREGVLDPVFASIEEWLGDNTQEYYDVLAAVGQGQWNPTNDALPWVRFCLRAHYQQAERTIRRNEEYSRLFAALEEEMNRKSVPARAILPLFDASLGLTITNPRYMLLSETERYTATRDLKLLVSLGWLLPRGEKRGRTYIATDALKQLRATTRVPRTRRDPYDIVRGREASNQKSLPGL
jgi:Fic family protein